MQSFLSRPYRPRRCTSFRLYFSRAWQFLEIVELVTELHRIMLPGISSLVDGHDPVAWEDDKVLTQVAPCRESNRRSLPIHLGRGLFPLDLLVDLVRLGLRRSAGPR